MKKLLFITLLLAVFTVLTTDAAAQCSICTRTAEQLGEKPAKGLNKGILYLLAVPLLIIGTISYRTWKSHKDSQET